MFKLIIMQKEIEELLKKYKVIATTSNYQLSKEIVEIIINSILENHKIELKHADTLNN